MLKPVVNYRMKTHPFAQMPAVAAEIPKNVIVPCPKHQPQKNVVAANHCPDCPYFCGLGAMVRADNDIEQKKLEETLTWSQMYAIRCQTIMEWTCQEIDL